MPDVAFNLLLSAGFAVGMGLGDGEDTLSEPYEDWMNEFLPLQVENHTISEEDRQRHGNGLFGVEPGVRLGAWQLSAPVEIAWLDWRTEAMALDWWTRTYTDTIAYRFRQPTVGLSAGRWVSPQARPYLGVSAFQWEQVYTTYQGEVDALYQVSYSERSSERLDSGWGGHLELGLALRPPTHEKPLAGVQGIRLAARASTLDGYTVLSGRVTWAFGVDYHPSGGGELSGGE